MTLYLHPSVAGTYTLSLTARLSRFDGTLIGTATVPTTFSSTAPVPVVFSFGTLSVSTGAEVGFNGNATLVRRVQEAGILVETSFVFGFDDLVGIFAASGLRWRMLSSTPLTPVSLPVGPPAVKSGA